MRLESGPAGAERNWQLIRVVIFLGFAGYFLYDGAIGYPAKNRTAAEQALQAEPFKGQVQYSGLGEHPDEEDYHRLRQLLQANPNLRDPENVRAALGTPQLVVGAGSGTTRRAAGMEYFVSRYGYARVPIEGGRVIASGIEWQTWAKSRAEVRGQFYWALVPLLPGLYFLWKLYKAVTLRVMVDEEGMIYAGRRIAFDKMTALRDYNPKGWIDLHYRDGEQERRLRLDNEKVRKFDEIVAALCASRSFRNEVAEYAAAKAREQAEEAAGAQAEQASGEPAEEPGGGHTEEPAGSPENDEQRPGSR